MGQKFDNVPLAVEQRNQAIKILNVYIVYNLDAWLRNPTNNFTYENCLFGATNILKITIKKIMGVVATECLMVQVHGVCLTLPEML